MGQVTFWDGKSLAQIKSFKAHAADALCLVISPVSLVGHFVGSRRGSQNRCLVCYRMGKRSIRLDLISELRSSPLYLRRMPSMVAAAAMTTRTALPLAQHRRVNGNRPRSSDCTSTTCERWPCSLDTRWRLEMELSLSTQASRRSWLPVGWI